jgi:hypothetical protein
MSGDQWFDLAKSMVVFAFWLAGAGVVIAMIGLFLGLSAGRRLDDTPPPKPPTFAERLLEWINVAFTKLFDPAVPAPTKFVALGMVVFMVGIAVLVVAIVPALVGIAQAALGGGGGDPSQSPSPSLSAT